MNAAIIVAGGEGVRFGSPSGKQLELIEGVPVLGHSLLAFERCERIDAIVLVAHPERCEEYSEATVEALGLRKVIAVVPGGGTRRASVACGIASLPLSVDVVAVHDGARPLITEGVVQAAIDELLAEPGLDGVVVGHPSYDTIKVVDASSVIVETPDRSRLWVAQTPQVFRASALQAAHEAAERDGFEGTDDASLVERRGGRVRMVPGPRENVKVTVAEDIAYASSVVRMRDEEGS